MTGEDEQEIREPVEIDGGRFAQGFFANKTHDEPFRAAANGACNMQLRTRGCAPGQNECVEARQDRLDQVDLALEAGDHCLLSAA